jgi:putative redox protein
MLMIAINIPTCSNDLAGFWHPAKVQDAFSDKVFIISHGFNGSMDGQSKAALLAEQAAQLGFHVLRYNFTPCQKLTTQIDELSAVVRYAQDQIAPNIYLLGRSMGGSASLAVAFFQRPIVKALCLWATPCDLDDTFQKALGAEYNTLRGGKSVTFSDGDRTVNLTCEFIADFGQYPLLDYIHSLAGLPVLIIHGNCDEVVAIEQAEAMYAATGQPKQFLIIDGGNHQFFGKTQQARATVLQWLSQISRRQ